MPLRPIRRRDGLRHSATVAALLAASGLLPLWPSALRAQAAAPGSPAAPPAWPEHWPGPWPQAAFQASDLARMLATLGVAQPQPSPAVRLSAPELAEDGRAVLLGVATELPGVQRLALLVAHNPTPLAALFELGPRAVAQQALRVKLARSTPVYAVALLADGQALFAHQDVQVSLGGCG